MKSYLLIICVFFCTYGQLYAQSNLVLNPGLENYYDTSEIGIASFANGFVRDWSDPTGSTSDLFAPNGIDATPPSNHFGFEYPHSGYCYGGAIIYGSTGLWHEYVQASFRNPLLASKAYAIECYVSVGELSSSCISNLGFYFSDTMINELGTLIIAVTPQYENPSSNMINTRTGWQRITGTYTAHGGEQFLSIGNFTDYALCPSVNCGAPSSDSFTYLFMDDVAIYDTAKVDTIHLCMNDSVQLGGIWRHNAGLYTDMVGGLPVKFYIEPRPYSANLTIIDRPFLPGDSVRISLLQKGGVDSSFSVSNFIWASHDTIIDIPMYNIYGCDSTIRYRCGTNIGTGVELNGKLDWHVYPNPANDFIIVRLSKNDPAMYSVTIIDIAGHDVLSHSLADDKIDISAVKSGMYFIKLVNTKTGAVVGTEKFVKSN